MTGGPSGSRPRSEPRQAYRLPAPKHNLLGMDAIDAATRSLIIKGWFNAQGELTQGEYLAQIERDRGVRVAPRTLRSWLSRLDDIGNARTSTYLREAFTAIRTAEARLRALIADAASSHAPEAAAGYAAPILASAQAEAGATTCDSGNTDGSIQSKRSRIKWDLMDE